MTSQIALQPFGATSYAFTPAELAEFEREILPFDDRQIVEPEKPARFDWSRLADASVIVAATLLLAVTCGLVGFGLGRASVLAGGLL